jgi:hypothetical protein
MMNRMELESFQDTLISAIDEDWQVCQQLKLNISRESFHGLHLQIRGVCIGGIESPTIVNGITMFREVHLQLPSNELGDILSVPKKIPVMKNGTSPYIYVDKGIFYSDGTTIFEKGTVIQVPLPDSDTPRYLKGYSFPFLGTAKPFYELRINPKNTGRCPGKCLFCHRGYAHRIKPSQIRKILLAKEIMKAIVEDYGADILKNVSHVSVITELFGREEPFLRFLEEMKWLLFKTGCVPGTKFRACAQDIRSEYGLRRLYSILDDKRYSYTLEVFSQRRKIMGKYKGIALIEVEKILKTAREIGFRDIKLNYVAGVDSISSFENGIRRFRSLGLIDTIGLSILTTFFPDQLNLRNIDAWSIKYYAKIIEVIKELGIPFYEPGCFEMGYPLKML